MAPPRKRRPVLRAQLRRSVAGVATAIVAGDCDIDGAVGRLVDALAERGRESSSDSLGKYLVRHGFAHDRERARGRR